MKSQLGASHSQPAPWLLGPSSTVFPRTSCALYSGWCHHLWLERHWHQSLKEASGEEKRKEGKETDRFPRPQQHFFTSKLGWPVVWIPAICTEPSSPRRMFPALRSLPKTRVWTLHDRFSRWSVTDELMRKLWWIHPRTWAQTQSLIDWLVDVYWNVWTPCVIMSQTQHFHLTVYENVHVITNSLQCFNLPTTLVLLDFIRRTHSL